MRETRQRLVVDAVSFGEVFRFQKILGSIIQSMQPPRLMIGLLMVLALVAVGNLWDKWFDTPSINPRGITVPWALESDIVADSILRPLAESSDSVKRYYADRVGAEPSDPNFTLPGKLDAAVIAERLDHNYKYERDRRVENGATLEQITREDAEHRAKLAAIDAIRPRGAYEATAQAASGTVVRVVQAVYWLRPELIFAAFADMFIHVPAALWSQKPWFVVAYGLFVLLVLGLGGGAICRMSACEVSGKERLRTTDAMVFATGNWVKLMLAPLLPLLLAAVLGVALVLMGFVLFSIPWLDVIGGLAYGINLLLGFLMAFVLIVYAGSFIMVLPAVAVENCGPADAVQRAFTYLLHRPLHVLGYAFVGVVGLALGYVVVALFAVTTLNVTGALTSSLTGSSAMSITGGFDLFDLSYAPGEYHREWHHETAAFFISTWQGLVILLVASWVVSYIFSSSTVIYMLMRKVVDEQDMSDIWRPGLVPGTLAAMPRAIGEKEADAMRGPGPSPQLIRTGSETLGSGGGAPTAQ